MNDERDPSIGPYGARYVKWHGLPLRLTAEQFGWLMRIQEQETSPTRKVEPMPDYAAAEAEAEAIREERSRLTREDDEYFEAMMRAVSDALSP